MAAASDTARAVGHGHGQAAKKKVNGFMGFRGKCGPSLSLASGANKTDGRARARDAAYYSGIFAAVPQKERSRFVTALWRADGHHAEWDFACAVYSAIRGFLAADGVTLQAWLGWAAVPLGLAARDQYLAAHGWSLVRAGSPPGSGFGPGHGWSLVRACDGGGDGGVRVVGGVRRTDDADESFLAGAAAAAAAQTL
ncbi:mating-type protein MAT alpha 1-domain-containing protein, partial [Lasiosphaeria ovina]